MYNKSSAFIALSSDMIWIQAVWHSDGISEIIFRKSWFWNKSAEDKRHETFPREQIVKKRLRKYQNRIFTYSLRVFKWTFTFEMWFIPSWTNRIKPHPHTRHFSGLTPSPSNNVACLLIFAWRYKRIAMTLSAEIWRFGYSKPYVMSDLIQIIWKTSQVRWKMKIDT